MDEKRRSSEMLIATIVIGILAIILLAQGTTTYEENTSVV